MNLSEIQARLDVLNAEAAELEAKENPTEEEVERLEVNNSERQDLTKVARDKERARKAQEASRRIGEPGPEPKRAVSEYTRDEVLSDPKRGFKCLAEFAGTVKNYQDHGAAAHDKRLLHAAATGMSQGVASDGGFAVPPTYAKEIWDGVNLATTSLMPYCDSYPVEGSSLTFTANAETSRVDGSRFGGIRGYWVGEATQMTTSAPKLRQLKLEPHTLAVLAYMTDKLLQNNMMALDRLLVEAATTEIVFKVNDAIINGTGVGQPLGILNGAGIASVGAETGQAATTIVTENIDKMWARLLPQARANAVWLINVDCEPQLAALNRAVGAAGALVYSPPGGVSAAPYATLKGRPVLAIEQCQTLGTTGDIWLAGLNYYALGLRGGVQADTSIHLRFDYNESAWRFLFHVDGQPWLAKAITPYKGSNTLAPFVKLDARS